MKNFNIPFLINLNLLTNSTYFAIYKMEKGDVLEEHDLESIKKFIDVLNKINNLLSNPYEFYQEEEEYAIPLISIFDQPDLQKSKFEKIIRALQNVMIHKIEKNEDIKAYLKNVSDQIEHLLQEEKISLNKAQRYSLTL